VRRFSVPDCKRARAYRFPRPGTGQNAFEGTTNGTSQHWTAFADEIGDDPMLFSLLKIFDDEPSYLGPPKATTQQGRDHCVVTSAAQILTAERRKEPLPLISGYRIDLDSCKTSTIVPRTSRRRTSRWKLTSAT
jgi:hypothetical protein